MSAPKKDRNSELMKLAGSKNGAYDPEAPAQWRYVLEHGTPEEQIVAWVKSKTTHMSHSPYAASQRGTALWIKHAAVDLGWTERTTRNVMNAVEKQGRIRLDREAERIWYCAEFDVPAAAEKRQKELSDSDFVQSQVPPYVFEFIKSLPAEIRKTRFRQAAEMIRWKLAVMKDGVAGLRKLIDEVENTTLEGWGAKKKRVSKPGANARKGQSVPVQIALLDVPDFVQEPRPQVVQTPDSTLHKPEKRFVHAAPSLSVTDSDTDLGAERVSIEENGPASVSRSEGTDRPKNAEVEVAEMLVAELATKLPGEAPSAALCARVVTQLRGAPVESLRKRVRHRLKRFDSMGLAEELAREVGEAWAAGARDRDRAVIERWSGTASWLDPEIQKEARDTLARSDASPELLTMARRVIEHAKTQKSKGAGT